MKPLALSLLAILFLGCANDGTKTADDAAADPASATAAPHAICGTWEATQVTINGKSDPGTDPAGKVVWVIRPDSTFHMQDNTEGTAEEMDGRWRLSGEVLSLIHPDNNETLDFKIHKLEKGTLVLQVLEETEAEILLSFQAR